MGLIVRIRGAGDEQPLQFGDDVATIVFGRDPDVCQVGFPPDETAVGREHCSLRRVLGEYQLLLDPDHLVVVDGKPAADGDELPHQCEIQLGPDGPVCLVRRVERTDMPPTMAQGHRPRQADELRAAATSAKRGRWLTIVVLLVVAAGVVYALTRPPPPEDDLQAVLRAARPSVYLVLTASPDGHERPAGTAWVVGDGVLATNAHVAAIHQEVSGAGGRLLVRSNTPPHRTYEVERITVHEGFQAFDELWADYAPAQGRTFEQADFVHSAMACDVALLHLSAPWEGLAPPLALADDEAVAALDAGQDVGYVGYPVEGMAFQGTPIRKPSPQLQVGLITAVTDFFGARPEAGSVADTAQLVQHSCPITGGSSGSPLLDARGHVVALVNAGNFAFLSGGGRVMTGVGVNFAQRVDLLRELLDATASERHQARLPQWRQAMEALYDEGYALLLARAESEVLELAQNELEASTNLTEMVELLHQESAEAAAAGRAEASPPGVTFDVPGAGVYVLVGTARPRVSSLELAVSLPDDGGPAGEVVVSPWDAAWARYRIVKITKPTTLSCRGVTEEKGRTVSFKLYRANSTPMTTDALRERILSDWLEVVGQQRGVAHRPELVSAATLKTESVRGAGGARVTRYFGTVADMPAGPVVATVVFPLNAQCGNAAVGRSDSNFAFVTYNAPPGPGYFCWLHFDLEEHASLDVWGEGASAGQPPEVHLYRAVPQK